MSFEAIDRAVRRDKVLLPANRSRSPGAPDLRYHEPASHGSLKAACRPRAGDMQAVDRGFAKTQWEPCQQCPGGER